MALSTVTSTISDFGNQKTFFDSIDELVKRRKELKNPNGLEFIYEMDEILNGNQDLLQPNTRALRDVKSKLDTTGIELSFFQPSTSKDDVESNVESAKEKDFNGKLKYSFKDSNNVDISVAFSKGSKKTLQLNEFGSSKVVTDSVNNFIEITDANSYKVGAKNSQGDKLEGGIKVIKKVNNKGKVLSKQYDLSQNIDTNGKPIITNWHKDSKYSITYNDNGEPDLKITSDKGLIYDLDIKGPNGMNLRYDHSDDKVKKFNIETESWDVVNETHKETDMNNQPNKTSKTPIFSPAENTGKGSPRSVSNELAGYELYEENKKLSNPDDCFVNPPQSQPIPQESFSSIETEGSDGSVESLNGFEAVDEDSLLGLEQGGDYQGEVVFQDEVNSQNEATSRGLATPVNRDFFQDTGDVQPMPKEERPTSGRAKVKEYLNDIGKVSKSKAFAKVSYDIGDKVLDGAKLAVGASLFLAGAAAAGVVVVAAVAAYEIARPIAAVAVGVTAGTVSLAVKGTAGVLSGIAGGAVANQARKYKIDGLLGGIFGGLKDGLEVTKGIINKMPSVFKSNKTESSNQLSDDFSSLQRNAETQEVTPEKKPSLFSRLRNAATYNPKDPKNKRTQSESLQKGSNTLNDALNPSNPRDQKSILEATIKENNLSNRNNTLVSQRLNSSESRDKGSDKSLITTSGGEVLPKQNSFSDRVVKENSGKELSA